MPIALGRHALGKTSLAQSRNANQSLRILAFYDIGTAGSGTIVVPESCRALVYAWGAGASGAVDSNGGSGGASSGGGGGAALHKVVRVGRGGAIAYTIGAPGAAPVGNAAGNNGNDTTVSLSGLLLRAGGGRGGLRGVGAAGGAGGVASGGDINRSGGAGGNQGVNGANGTNGGTGGVAGGVGAPGGGGASAGFDDIGWPLDGGDGGAASNGTPTAPSGSGGGSGGGGTGGAAGAPGRLVVILVKIV